MRSRNFVPETFSDIYQPNLIALQTATWEDRERKKTQKRSNLHFERVTIKDIERDVI